ncbi:MAG: riboflavin synthase [Candidatus Latescibacterota bacterium]|nr:riboflavin synthase [Candidatus Latescibacterota bacterium]
MFTGLVQEVGRVRGIDKRGTFQVLNVEAKTVLNDLSIGDSIAINGVCQTIVDFDDHRFSVECVAETLSRTNLSKVEVGQPVNLETALRLSDRLGGHLVQGHIDDIGHVKKLTERNNEWLLHVSVPKSLHPYVVFKGSIAIDGTSLTVSNVDSEGFTVSVIPHTFKNTVLCYRRVGDPVNLEVDVIARYIEQQVTIKNQSNRGLTLKTLRQMGY